jgi:hypothetical protein
MRLFSCDRTGSAARATHPRVAAATRGWALRFRQDVPLSACGHLRWGDRLSWRGPLNWHGRRYSDGLPGPGERPHACERGLGKPASMPAEPNWTGQAFGRPASMRGGPNWTGRAFGPPASMSEGPNWTELGRGKPASTHEGPSRTGWTLGKSASTAAPAELSKSGPALGNSVSTGRFPTAQHRPARSGGRHRVAARSSICWAGSRCHCRPRSWNGRPGSGQRSCRPENDRAVPGPAGWRSVSGDC